MKLLGYASCFTHFSRILLRFPFALSHHKRTRPVFYFLSISKVKSLMSMANDRASAMTPSAWLFFFCFLFLNHRNIRPRMRAPILFQVNKWRLINYSKWPIYKGKLNSPHDILYTTLLGKIQDGGFIRAFLFSFWTPVTWQSTHSRSNISMFLTDQCDPI